MKTTMNTATFNQTLSFDLPKPQAVRRSIPAPARRQLLPTLTLSRRPAARAATPVRTAGSVIMPDRSVSTAEKVAFSLIALAGAAALAEACGLMARLAPQWDSFSDLIARLIA